MNEPVPTSERRRNAPTWYVTLTRIVFYLIPVLLLVMILLPFALMVLISLGSGWAFPRLLPDRMDLAAWRHFLSDRDQMLIAIATSAVMSLTVGVFSVSGGLLIGRAVRRTGSRFAHFLIYLPFVISPVVVGICLYDLLIRMRVIGNVVGVILMQTVFALSFSSVFFYELWSPRAERLEQLVSNFGGSRWDVWRHAVFPQISGLILVCFLQTALYSWLDYGIVSIVGGGYVPSVTTRLFGYIREASVNQAAQASLILLAPALLGFLITTSVYFLRLTLPGDTRQSS
ncbi:ABC transporter permease [Schlesneria paludicola]|uniref:ABC transporter permease n=1 Tax=Schlesneria paludicola TaxID=360056 RepID=UPI00029A2FF0|nr:ABC transporter permease subunit [Schlesneria paludicola]